jgi:hypothetical protein
VPHLRQDQAGGDERRAEPPTTSSSPCSRYVVDRSIADPGSGAFLIPGPGIGRKSRSGSGEKCLSYNMRSRDLVIILTLDSRSKMGKIRIRDKFPGSATLVDWEQLCFTCCTCTHVFLYCSKSLFQGWKKPGFFF